MVVIIRIAVPPSIGSSVSHEMFVLVLEGSGKEISSCIFNWWNQGGWRVVQKKKKKEKQ
jgi:hypothetical protein